MDTVCDNFSVCKSTEQDRGAGTLTEQHLRAKGWHIYHGRTNSGQEHHAVLCPRCATNRRRELAPPPGLRPGQEELFLIEAIVNEA